jgi:hypothetical protein
MDLHSGFRQSRSPGAKHNLLTHSTKSPYDPPTVLALNTTFSIRITSTHGYKRSSIEHDGSADNPFSRHIKCLDRKLCPMTKTITLSAGALLSGFLGGVVAQSISPAVVAAAQTAVTAAQAIVAGHPNPSWTFIYAPGPAAPLRATDTNGRRSGQFSSRTSDNPGSNTDTTIPLECLVVNDNMITGHQSWCLYEQANLLSTAVKSYHINHESSVASFWPAVGADPFTPNPLGSVYVQRLDSGVGSGATPNNITAYLSLVTNGAKAKTGIIIGNDALDGNNEAIAMATGHRINWYSAPKTIAAQILSGPGSPIGAVSCLGRCLYIRTDGVSKSTLYVNETGTGTSGWVAK